MANEKVLVAKQAVIDEIADKLSNAQSVVVAEYRGLTVDEVTELRRALRAENVELKVYKNKLALRATEACGKQELDEFLTGPNAIAFGHDDAVAPARVLAKFAKDHEALVIKTAIVEGKLLSKEEVMELSKLPNKEGMLSMLLACLKAPVSKVARAVKAVADKEAEGSAEEAAPAEAEAGYQSYIPQEGREKYVFYVKEQLLLQTLIRHGEKVMCYVETEENTETPLTVIEYISMDLKQDELQFHNPLHRKILAEAEAHLHDPNFTAERYFLAHPDPTISKLAADMINDRYQLSKSNSQAMVKDEERLHELVPHQLIDFKLAILEEDMKYTLQALNKPEVVANADKCLEVMAHFKELSELQKIMAKRAGDRVVLK